MAAEADDALSARAVMLTATVTLRVDAEWWFGADPDVECDAIADALGNIGFDVLAVRLAKSRQDTAS